MPSSMTINWYTRDSLYIPNIQTKSTRWYEIQRYTRHTNNNTANYQRHPLLWRWYVPLTPVPPPGLAAQDPGRLGGHLGWMVLGGVEKQIQTVLKVGFESDGLLTHLVKCWFRNAIYSCLRDLLIRSRPRFYSGVKQPVPGLQQHGCGSVLYSSLPNRSK